MVTVLEYGAMGDSTVNLEGAEAHKRGKITAQFGELVVSSDCDSGIDCSSSRVGD